MPKRNATTLFEDGERGPLEIGAIRMRNGDLMLTDLGTRNGTFLERGGDRQRVTELALHDGDLIIVGATRMPWSWILRATKHEFSSRGSHRYLELPRRPDLPGVPRRPFVGWSPRTNVKP